MAPSRAETPRARANRQSPTRASHPVVALGCAAHRTDAGVDDLEHRAALGPSARIPALSPGVDTLAPPPSMDQRDCHLFSSPPTCSCSCDRGGVRVFAIAASHHTIASTLLSPGVPLHPRSIIAARSTWIPVTHSTHLHRHDSTSLHGPTQPPAQHAEIGHTTTHQ